jgi:predicted HAD superfamily hydrolase
MAATTGECDAMTEIETEIARQRTHVRVYITADATSSRKAIADAKEKFCQDENFQKDEVTAEMFDKYYDRERDCLRRRIVVLPNLDTDSI